MKVAAIQMVSGASVQATCAARALLGEAARAGADSPCCPNISASWARRTRDKLARARDARRGRRSRRFLARAPRANWACGSSAARCRWRRATKPHVRNTQPASSRRRASCVARYDKIHLFRFDNGRERYDEARVIERGARAGGLRRCRRATASLAHRHERLLRPALSRAVPRAARRRAAGAQRLHLCRPGQAHWELLLRARAVENLAYVVAPAQGGVHENGRRTWGHSMVVDPWGVVLAQQRRRRRASWSAELDAARQAQVRAQLPALEHRVL